MTIYIDSRLKTNINQIKLEEGEELITNLIFSSYRYNHPISKHYMPE